MFPWCPGRGFNSIDGFIVKRDKNDYVLIIKDNRKPGYSDLFCGNDGRKLRCDRRSGSGSRNDQ